VAGLNRRHTTASGCPDVHYPPRTPTAVHPLRGPSAAVHPLAASRSAANGRIQPLHHLRRIPKIAKPAALRSSGQTDKGSHINPPPLPPPSPPPPTYQFARNVPIQGRHHNPPTASSRAPHSITRICPARSHPRCFPGARQAPKVAIGARRYDPPRPCISGACSRPASGPATRRCLAHQQRRRPKMNNAFARPCSFCASAL